jgi:hypothetical protein
MKKSRIYFSLVIAVLATLASCTVTKRHYAPGYHVEWKHFSAPSKVTNPEKDVFVATEQNSVESNVVSEMPGLDISANEQTELIALVPAKNNESSAVNFSKSLNSAGVLKSEVKQAVKNQKKQYNQEPTSVKAMSEKGPDALSWFIWIAAILCIPVFGGPLFILIWTSSKNGDVDWKPVLTSFLLYLLCWIPGLIYDIIWINKNCSGSLFND